MASYRNNIEFIAIAANAGEFTGGYYSEILMRIRSRLEDDCIRYPGSARRPILPPYAHNQAYIRWFEIRLHPDNSRIPAPYRNRDNMVTLRLRRDDLYVIGYRVAYENVWYEFGVDGRDPHLIPGSRFLGYDGGYNTLIGRAGGRPVLSAEALINSAVNLALGETGTIARALLIFVLMFCEGARFIPVEQHLLNTFDGGQMLPTWIVGERGLTQNWQDFSERVLHPEVPWVPVTITIEVNWEIRDVVVRSIPEMLQYLAIVKKEN